MPETNVVYHYCRIQTFRDILRSRTLRLTNIHFMNDYEEHIRFINQANDLILECQERAPNPWHENLAKPFPVNWTPYVGCFSSEPDLLSQWRAYTNNGEGFAVGFSADYLTKRIADYRRKQRAFSLSFDRVEYNTDSQHKMLRNLVEGNAIIVECNDNSICEEDRIGLQALATQAVVWKYAAYCKSPAFQEESEWRIVFIPQIKKGSDGTSLVYEKSISHLGFRLTDNAIEPFFEFDFGLPIPDCTPIRRIGLGPKNYARNDHDSLDSLKLFLLQHGYDPDEIDIYNSNATYR